MVAQQQQPLQTTENEGEVVSGHAWSNGSFLSLSPVPSARACNSIGNLWGNPACWAIQSARVSAVQREVVAGTRAEFMMLLLALGFVVFLAFLILLLVAIVWNAPPSHCPLTD